MIFNRAKSPFHLVTYITVIIATVVIATFVATFLTLYSSYKFETKLVDRNQEIITSGLAGGSLAFAIATGDINLAETIVRDQFKHIEVYSIEVKDYRGDIFLRKEKSQGPQTTVDLQKRTAEILLPYSVGGGHKRVGELTLYFSSKELSTKVNSQLTRAVLGWTVVILILVIIIVSFGVHISKMVSRILGTIELIKQGEADIGVTGNTLLFEEAVVNTSLSALALELSTKRKQLEHSVRSADKSRKLAIVARESKDAFTRILCHDISTPVSTVVHLITVLERQLNSENLTNECRATLKHTVSASRVLKSVTKELIDLETFDGTKIDVTPEKVNLQLFFEQISVIHQPRATNKNLIFEVQRAVDDTRDCNVLIDGKKLLLIINNLIDNATKYTHAGYVSVSWRLQEDVVFVEVKDSGQGIPSDKLEFIFERYTQINDPKIYKHSGFGIGLYYVREYLRALGGNYTVLSAKELGSSFKISVPYKSARNDTSPTIEAASVATDILIIDDDESACYTLKKLLEERGLSSTSVYFPELGLQKVLSGDYGLVFVDYHMNGLSGDALLKSARSGLAGRPTFFVCFTAEADPDSLSMLRGLFDYVCTKLELSENLESILKSYALSKTHTTRILNSLTRNS